MNILIICILLFTFTLKTEGDNMNSSPRDTSSVESSSGTNITTSTSSVSYSPGSNINNTTSTSTSLVESSPGTNGTNTQSSVLSSTDGKTTYTNSITNLEMHHNNASKSPTKNYSLFGEHDKLRMIVTFILGMIFSAMIFSTVFCCVLICNRCRTTGTNADKEYIVLEAVKSEHDQTMIQSDDDQADERVPLQAQSTMTNASVMNSGTEEELKILEKDESEGAGDANDVPYASINFSLLQKKDDGNIKPQNVESDYAEIQLKKLNEGEKDETLQDGIKQDGVKQDEVKHDDMKQSELKQDEVEQDEVKQDEVKKAEVKQGEVKQDVLKEAVNGGMETQKQRE